MSRRRISMGLLALVAAGLSLWVLGAAIAADRLSGQVFFAILPLLMLFGIGWRGFTDKPD